MRTSIVTALFGIMLSGPAFGAAGLSADQPPTVPAQQAPAAPTTGPAPSVTRSSDAARYAAREERAPQLERFKGGAVGIYIGGSVLAVALVVVLILILI